MRSPANLSTGSHPSRLAGLDGLRAVAILLVVAYHGLIRWNVALPPLIKTMVQHGDFGVTIFFVLSGFLITHLLCREEQGAGRVALGGFYFRRAFRILPAAFFYLAVIGILGLLGQLTVAPGDVAASALFVRNLTYRTFGPASTAHYWSLSIEEQFYLLWPMVFVLTRGRRRIWITGGLVVIAPVWRLAAQRLGVGLDVYLSRTDLLFDSLLMGCLLALLRADPVAGKVMRGRFLQRPSTLLAGVGLMLIAGFFYECLPRGLEPVRLTLAYLSVAVCINYLVQGHQGLTNRLLETPPLVCIGRLSFSLYLWQQLFILREGQLNNYELQGLWRDLSLTALLAMLSYVAVERPFLRWRDRLVRSRAGLEACTTNEVAAESRVHEPRPC